MESCKAVASRRKRIGVAKMWSPVAQGGKMFPSAGQQTPAESHRQRAGGEVVQGGVGRTLLAFLPLSGSPPTTHQVLGCTVLYGQTWHSNQKENLDQFGDADKTRVGFCVNPLSDFPVWLILLGPQGSGKVLKMVVVSA